MRYRLEETGNPLRSSGPEEALLPKKPASSPSTVLGEKKDASLYERYQAVTTNDIVATC